MRNLEPQKSLAICYAILMGKGSVLHLTRFQKSTRGLFLLFEELSRLSEESDFLSETRADDRES
jgi:hypothetical protein